MCNNTCGNNYGSCGCSSQDQVNWQVLLDIAQNGKPTEVEFFEGHNSETITVKGTLPADRASVKVWYNGNLLNDDTISGFSEVKGYVYVSSTSEIRLSFTPEGSKKVDNFRVEYCQD